MGTEPLPKASSMHPSRWAATPPNAVLIAQRQRGRCGGLLSSMCRLCRAWDSHVGRAPKETKRRRTKRHVLPVGFQEVLSESRAPPGKLLKFAAEADTKHAELLSTRSATSPAQTSEDSPNFPRRGGHQTPVPAICAHMRPPTTARSLRQKRSCQHMVSAHQISPGSFHLRSRPRM